MNKQEIDEVWQQLTVKIEEEVLGTCLSGG